MYITLSSLEDGCHKHVKNKANSPVGCSGVCTGTATSPHKELHWIGLPLYQVEWRKDTSDNGWILMFHEPFWKCPGSPFLAKKGSYSGMQEKTQNISLVLKIIFKTGRQVFFTSNLSVLVFIFHLFLHKSQTLGIIFSKFQIKWPFISACLSRNPDLDA